MDLLVLGRIKFAAAERSGLGQREQESLQTVGGLDAVVFGNELWNEKMIGMNHDCPDAFGCEARRGIDYSRRPIGSCSARKNHKSCPRLHWLKPFEKVYVGFWRHRRFRILKQLLKLAGRASVVAIADSELNAEVQRTPMPAKHHFAKKKKIFIIRFSSYLVSLIPAARTTLFTPREPICCVPFFDRCTLTSRERVGFIDC